ncbi:ArsR/SmtB family transcription factor [Corynebacterium kutscheri]|uniref:ArsR/SmtB family transcription factor n=1 Tax=Corynebacterium kutscheri TaxID=35755 RepID=UPI0006238976
MQKTEDGAVTYDPNRNYNAVAHIFRAIDSPLRLKILSLLQERDHFVYELVNTLGSSQPLISQHLRVLKQAKLIHNERTGRQMVYRLSEPRAMEIIELGFNIDHSRKSGSR